MVDVNPSMDVNQSNSHAFFVSLTMVSMAEIFDKTWFVAFVMAMRYDKCIVFWSCFCGLVLHVFIAAAFGIAFMHLLSPRTLSLLAAGLYTVFAILYGYDWYTSDADSDMIEAGKEEVTAEAFADTENAIEEAQYGTILSEKSHPKKTPRGEDAIQKAQEMAGIFWQCFVMVFIAEWGDRTQIAMIGIHATLPLIPVMIGSTIAFGLLTLSAVLLGRLLGDKTLSESTVKGVCALSFLVFALVAFHDVMTAHGTTKLL